METWGAEPEPRLHLPRPANVSTYEHASCHYLDVLLRDGLSYGTVADRDENEFCMQSCFRLRVLIPVSKARTQGGVPPPVGMAADASA